MITTMNRIFVNPDYAEQFEDNFRNRAGLVDRMEGFVSNQLLRPSTPGDPYIVLTLWATRKSFENWVRSEAQRRRSTRRSKRCGWRPWSISSTQVSLVGLVS